MVQPNPVTPSPCTLRCPFSQKAVARSGRHSRHCDWCHRHRRRGRLRDGDKLTVNFTADTRDSKHRNELVAKLGGD